MRVGWDTAIDLGRKIIIDALWVLVCYEQASKDASQSRRIVPSPIGMFTVVEVVGAVEYKGWRWCSWSKV